MKFKKTALMMAVTLMLMSGCSGMDKPEPADDGTDFASSFDSAPVETTLIQGNPSGVWFMLSSGIIECLSTTYPGSILNTSPGHVQSNVNRLCAGESEFALTHSHVALEQNKATSEGADNPEVYGLAAFYSSSAQLVLSKELGITSFSEIIDKKLPLTISIGTAGNTHQELFNKIISYYGLSLADMEEWGFKVLYKGSDESAPMLTDGTIDGYFLIMGAPLVSIVENATNMELNLVKFDDDMINQLCEDYGYYKNTIPAGTYNFLEEDYETLSDYTILATTENASDETVYKLVRSIYENIDYLSAVHATLKDISAETMIGRLKLPIHPGALQYFEDAGLID